MSYLRRMISVMLVLSMIITSCVVFDVKVVNAATEKEIFRDNNCKVTFKVNSQWDSAFEGQFIIENTGKENLENWKFQVTFPHEITSLWDGKIVSHKGDIYVIQHPDWNTKIASGGKAVIGLNAKKGKDIVFPSDCMLLMDQHNVDKEDFTIMYKTTSDWGDAFNGEISIKNHTNKKIEGWELAFDFKKEITNFWTAKIKSKEGNHYIIRNDEWNSVIKPGETIRLGFEGKPGKVTEEPYNYQLSEVENDYNNEVEKPEGDIDISKIDWKKDTDGDSIPDDVERIYGTDKEKADTDGDNLPDAYEIEILETDPAKNDTDDNGITDDKEDFDKDGLSNLSEYHQKTEPMLVDTDGDSLLDGEEVNKYATDPLLEDTDKDGMKDGDEVICGLDPKKSMTHAGIPDKEYKMEQKITEDMLDINKDIKEFQVSLDLTASGCVQNRIAVYDSVSKNVLDGNRAILGDLITMYYNGGTISDVTIKFRIEDAYAKDSFPQTDGIDEELTGLKRYQIFKLMEEDAKENAGLLLPVETTHDLAANTVSAKVDELGEYCVMDMNMWLYDLGIRVEDFSDSQENRINGISEEITNTDDTPSPDYVPITKEELKERIAERNKFGGKPTKLKERINRQVDLTIVIDVSQSMDKTISRVQENIGSLVERLYGHNITLHTSVVKFTEYKEGQEENTKVLKTKSGSTWAKNSGEAMELLSKLKIAAGKEETPIDGMGMGQKLDYRAGAEKYMVLLTDEKCNPVNRYGIKDLNEMGKLLKKDNITTCVVTKGALAETYSPISTLTGGESFDISTNFSVGIEQLILKNITGDGQFSGVSGMTLETVTLKKRPEKGGKTDTDSDGLTDSEEINWDLVKSAGTQEWNTRGTFLGSSNKSYIKNSLDRFEPKQVAAASSLYFIPEKSKLNAKDSDGDKISDIDDPRPLKYDINSITLFESKKGKIRDENGKIPLDMTSGDFSKKQVQKLHPLFVAQLNVPVSVLKATFRSMIFLLSGGELIKVGQDMIDHFIDGTGNDYSNRALTSKFKNHSNTQKFVKTMEKQFREMLEEDKCELLKLYYIQGNKFDKWAQSSITYPKFTKLTDNFNGMGILIHDIWSCKVEITNYKVTTKKYSGTMKFTFYDHFGLDDNDITKGFGHIPEFRAWFTLQHYTKFNSKYKPFVTVCSFEIPFKGDYSK